ncbi:nitroreductase family protein [Brevibacillus dissolubilis]|uniref:nitroreductase family protein n=1 Tax=Brevibacillus dissolubilis TaxID=1844116 RepID=UPI001115B0AC|nr:nitroreductase family protein [Brevibacillus dissolubilis]
MSFEEIVKGRTSVRKYQTDYEMPNEDLQEILSLAAQAPSSWNLQHWRYLVVTKPEIKERLLPLSYNQKQVVDANAVIIILGDLEADKTGRAIYEAAANAGQMSQEVANNLIGQIEGAYQMGGQAYARDEAYLNVGLTAMQLMLAARAKGYDTCPMRGFDRDAVTKELNIPSRYTPIVMLTLGKAAAPGHPSGRLSLDELVISESF